MAETQWTSERRLYLTKDGRVVERGDPDAISLLVSAGGTLPHERAKALGLVDGDGAQQAESKAVEAPAENKAVTRKATKRKKAGG